MMQQAIDAMPVVAILRGVTSAEAAKIGSVLYDSGIRCIEVPLNSPSPFDSIKALATSIPGDCLIGAGTVVAVEDVRRVADAGGRLIVTPNASRGVTQMAAALGMEVIPGVATPTDAFQAIDSGAHWLKLFPASTYGPAHLKAIRAVLPRHVKFLAVGGIGPENFFEWSAAGVAGFGIGSELYRAGDSAVDVERKVTAIKAAL